MNMLARIEASHEYPSQLSPEARAYLSRIRGRGWLDDIRTAFERADQLKILFVGETIIDEYRYVGPLAKPSKEFILATVETRPPEQFLGGVVAASLHGDWASTKVLTDDGEPIKKTRFVDDAFTRKLFEVYSKPRLELSKPQRAHFQLKLVEALDGGCDVAIVMDFGHGLITGPERNRISLSLKLPVPVFIAVNAQTNAGNYGFNPITKYKRAELVCIDLPEAQLAVGERMDAPEAHDALSGRGFGHAIITHGRNGAYCPQHVPAFSTRAIDTIGAGDAFLAVAAPLVAAGLDLEQAAFCGNVAGAIKTDIVGHRRHVGRGELMERIGELLG